MPKKITDLTLLTTADDSDVFAVVDVSAGTTKKVTRYGLKTSSEQVQMVAEDYDAVASGAGTIPLDSSVPQDSEGDEYMAVTISPKDDTNILVVEAEAMLATDQIARHIVGALFHDGSANAIGARSTAADAADTPVTLNVTAKMVAGTTGPITFTFRAGAGTNAANTTFNGQGGALWFGAAAKSFIKVTEYKAA